MTRSVIWRCPCDGRQHLATLTGNDHDGYALVALCGKTVERIRLCDVIPNGTLTCEQCRTEERLAALAKGTAA